MNGKVSSMRGGVWLLAVGILGCGIDDGQPGEVWRTPVAMGESGAERPAQRFEDPEVRMPLAKPFGEEANQRSDRWSSMASSFGAWGLEGQDPGGIWAALLRNGGVLSVRSGSVPPLSGVGFRLPEESTQAEMLGEVAGTDAGIGLAKRGDAAVVFVCGGPNTFRTLTHWYQGRVTTDGQQWTVSSDGWSVSGAGSAWGMGGVVTGPGGQIWGFSLRAVDPSTKDGLYRRRDGRGTAGVLLKKSASEPEIGGVYIDSAGHVQQIVPLRNPVYDRHGFGVQIIQDGVPTVVHVEPVMHQLGGN